MLGRETGAGSLGSYSVECGPPDLRPEGQTGPSRKASRVELTSESYDMDMRRFKNHLQGLGLYPENSEMLSLKGLARNRAQKADSCEAEHKWKAVQGAPSKCLLFSSPVRQGPQ